MKTPIENLILDDYPNGSVTQWYGENKELYRRWGLEGHNGIDIVAPWGTPMYAIEDAVVADVEYNPEGYGKYVRIRSKKLHDGMYRCWTYGHCSEIHVKGGEEVKEGQHIADMGNTGFVVSGANPWWEHNPYAGTHLHLGLRFLVPDENGWKYPTDTVRIQVKDYDNGRKGAFDPVIVLKDLLPGDRRPQMLTMLSLLNQTVVLLKKLKEMKHG